MRRNRPLAQMNAISVPRRRRDIDPQPVPTFQPDAKAPPPPPTPDSEEQAVEAAINRMVEAAYT